MPTRSPNEDLFEDSRMSFGEHLEELRRALIRALIGVAIGCVFGFLMANQVVQLLERPLVRAVAKFQQRQSRLAVQQQYGYVPPEFEPWYDQDLMVPQTMYVDPGELAQALGNIRPDFIQDLDLTPYRFRAGHLPLDHLTGLCRQFTDPQGDNVEQISVLWDLLSPQHQQQIRQIGQQETATDRDVAKVVAVLNTLVDQPSILESPSFQPWLIAPPQSFLSRLQPTEDRPLAQMFERWKSTHDAELQRRLNRALIAKTFDDWIPPLRLDMVPLQVWRKMDVKPQALSATEPFMIWVKAGVFTGLLISSPWALLQIWLFVAAGLYPHEQRYVYLFLPISLSLFAAGALLAFFFVFEPVLDFLFSFNANLGIAPDIRINNWLSFVMFLPIGFGIAFQLPLVMLFLNRIHIFSVQIYLNKWRIAVMVIFTLSMLLTPADPVSMIMLAIPLTILYFLGIGLCHWLPNATQPYGATTPDID